MQDLEIWRRAEIAHNHGNRQEAIALYSQLLGSPCYFLNAHVRIAALQPLQQASAKPSLVWRVAEKFPIVRQALANVEFKEELIEYNPDVSFGHQYDSSPQCMVCVDWRVNEASSLNYYLQARRSGCRMILFHLSDENFMDYHLLYPLFQKVFRQYGGQLVETYKNVHLFPSAGAELSWSFPDIAAQAKSGSRRFAWNFLGDDTKNDRREALATFQDLKEPFIFTVSDFFDARKMPKEEYLRALSQSVFTLCPMGYTHVETMRFWEALECGSIPLFAHPQHANYYAQYFGGSGFPLPIFASWAQALSYAKALLNDTVNLQQVFHRVQDWWGTYKSQLSQHFQTTLKEAWA